MVKNLVRASVTMAILGIFGISTSAAAAVDQGAGPDSREHPIKMTFSGSIIPTTLVVQPNSITDEELLAGHGSLGSFTFRKLRTDDTVPQSFGVCGSGVGPNLRVAAGGGVFRFEDGSLLTVVITEGALCIDFDHMVGNLTESYQITGGSGRLAGATGTLQATGTLHAVLFSASNAAVLLTNTGAFTGTVRLP